MRTGITLGPLFFAIFLTACGSSSENSPAGAPVITSLGAYDFNVAGGEEIEIRGRNLAADNTAVEIDGVPCPLSAAASATLVRCRTPALPGVKLRELTLTHRGGSTRSWRRLRFNVVLGQTSVNERRSRGAAAGLSTPYGMSVGGGKLAVADYANNRVLLWNSVPTSMMAPADLVVGQPTKEYTEALLVPTAASLRTPMGVFTDGTRLIVADTGNHRVLVWNTFPTASGQTADLVLGQADFASTGINNGGLSGATLSGPRGVSFDGSQLAVADTGNNRILFWNGLPSANGSPAAYVLGQASLAGNAGNSGPNTAPCGGAAGRNLCSASAPGSVSQTANRVYVADSGNNRVLVYSSPITGNQPAASFVIGQPTGLTGTANNGPNTAPCGGVAGLNACALSNPTVVRQVGNSLAIVDRGNNRILLYAAIPSANTPPANFALGQATLLTNLSSVIVASAQSIYAPYDLAFSGQYFFVSDSGVNRVLGWNALPAANQAAANFVLGQRSFANTSANYHDLVPGRLDLDDPHGVVLRGGKLFVADRTNNRVLIWNSIPQVNNEEPSVVVGQPNLRTSLINNAPATAACGSNATGVNRCSLNAAIGIASNGYSFAVADRMNNRVLFWNQIPTTNHAPADLVLGQADFTGFAGNNGPNTPACGGAAGRNACSMSSPLSVDFDGARLVVADQNNNRVLIWNSMPTVNQQPADVVLGQATMLTGAANIGPNTPACDNTAGISRCTLNGPYGAFLRDGRVFVADNSNHRLLVWNTYPVANAAPADIVIGQPGFVTGTANIGGLGPAGLNGLMGVEFTGDKTYVLDRGNSRLLWWAGLPASGSAASGVHGQPDFVTIKPTEISRSDADTYGQPLWISVNQGVMVTSEHLGDRVMLRPLDPDASDY